MPAWLRIQHIRPRSPPELRIWQAPRWPATTSGPSPPQPPGCHTTDGHFNHPGKPGHGRALNQIVSATFNKAMTRPPSPTSPATFTLLAQGSTTPVTGWLLTRRLEYADVHTTANLVQNTCIQPHHHAAQDLGRCTEWWNCLWQQHRRQLRLDLYHRYDSKRRPPQIVLTVRQQRLKCSTNQAVSAPFRRR